MGWLIFRADKQALSKAELRRFVVIFYDGDSDHSRYGSSGVAFSSQGVAKPRIKLYVGANRSRLGGDSAFEAIRRRFNAVLTSS
jgi:hypothetical protein